MNSRNLDTEIAEKVMGWKREKRKMWAGEKNVSGYGLNTHLDRGDKDRQFTIACYLPRYSENLSEAMLVVEKMISLGWKYDIHNEHCGKGEHVCVFKGRGLYHAVSTSQSEAICLAALSALKSKGGG